MAQGAMQACSRVAQPLPPGGWVGWAALGTADRSTKGTLDAAVRLCYGHATISRHVGKVEIDRLGLRTGRALLFRTLRTTLNS
jgi:hypothetical protein